MYTSKFFFCEMSKPHSQLCVSQRTSSWLNNHIMKKPNTDLFGERRNNTSSWCSFFPISEGTHARCVDFSRISSFLHSGRLTTPEHIGTQHSSRDIRLGVCKCLEKSAPSTAKACNQTIQPLPLLKQKRKIYCIEDVLGL